MLFNKTYKTFYTSLFICLIVSVVFCTCGCAKLTKNKDNVSESSVKTNSELSDQTKVNELLENSKNVQKKNSFYIKIHAINALGKKFEHDIYFYKKGNKWRSEEYLNTENTDNRNIKSISVFDGEKMDYWGEMEDENHPGIYLPHSLVINYSMQEYTDYKKEYENTKIEFFNKTLEQIIDEYKFGFYILNWYPDNRYIKRQPTSYAAELGAPIAEAKPEIKGNDIVNGYKCIWIKFNDYISACVSKDYGIAINWSSYWIEHYGSKEEDKYMIYEVVEVKNTDIDGYEVDDKMFELPNIKPKHIYGQY